MDNDFCVDKQKITIIGAGAVGTTIAYTLSLNEWLKKIVLVDINIAKIKGETLDIRHGVLALPNTNVDYGDYYDCKDSDLIILSAGRGRKPNESRIDLINDNIGIINNIIDCLLPYYNNCPIMVVSNPVDILTYVVCKRMNVFDGRVFGTGCILDSSRLTRIVADYIGVSSDYIEAYVIGEHGEGQVPLWSKTAIAGMPIEEFCGAEKIKWNNSIKQDIANKLKNMGTEIIKCKGSTFYGIAECVCQLSKAILTNDAIIESVSSPLVYKGEKYQMALSLPSLIGFKGVARQLDVQLDEVEEREFRKTIEKIDDIMSGL